MWSVVELWLKALCRKIFALQGIRRHPIASRLRPRVFVAACNGKADCHTAFRHQLAGFGDAGLGDVERLHCESLFGQPDAVAALAIGSAQHAVASRPHTRAVTQPTVRPRVKQAAGGRQTADSKSVLDR